MVNYYKILEMPEVFEVDLVALERQYLEMQARLHPDCGGSNAESSAINAAYRVMKDDLLRAEHILGLAGVSIPAPDVEFISRVVEMAGDESAPSDVRGEIAATMDSMRAFIVDGNYVDAASCLARIKCLNRLVVL